jgi:general secretion pathway protein G
MTRSRRYAFTLIEVLMVVIVMAILAATIIPQFSMSTTDAQKSSLKVSLQTVNTQTEFYKNQHNGKFPTITNFVDQMTKKTDMTGATTGSADALIYGPYIQGQFPGNPFNGSNAVVAVATEGTVPTGVVAGIAGWQYDQSNGGFYANNAEAYVAGF